MAYNGIAYPSWRRRMAENIHVHPPGKSKRERTINQCWLVYKFEPITYAEAHYGSILETNGVDGIMGLRYTLGTRATSTCWAILGVVPDGLGERLDAQLDECHMARFAAASTARVQQRLQSSRNSQILSKGSRGSFSGGFPFQVVFGWDFNAGCIWPASCTASFPSFRGGQGQLDVLFGA